MNSGRPKRPGETSALNPLRRGPSVFAAALIGAFVVRDRFPLGALAETTPATGMPKLGAHGESVGGFYSQLASQLSTVAQQWVLSSDFLASAERFSVDSQSLDEAAYAYSFGDSGLRTGLLLNNLIGRAVPPELRGRLWGDESDIFSPTESANGRSTLASRTLAKPNESPEDSGRAEDAAERAEPDVKPEGEPGKDSALDFLDGLDVSADPGFAQILARLEVTSASETDLADAMDPTTFSPLELASGGVGSLGGGGSSSSGSSGSSGFSGRVFDGYVANMDVFIDLNGNLQWDEGELKTVTGADGSYAFSEDAPVGAMIVALGNADTMDISTGANVDMLVASAGMQYISPLSSAYAFAANDDERDALLTAVGLETLNFDPIAIVQAMADTGSAEFADAATMVKSGAALLSLASNTASIASGITGSDTTTATRAFFSALATQGEEALSDILVGVDEADSSTVLALIKGTLNVASGVADYVASLGANSSDLEAILSSSATAIRGLTSAINKVDMTQSGGLADMFSTAAVAQIQLKSSISSVADLVAAGDYSGARASATAATSAYTGASLAALKVEAEQFAALNVDDGSAIATRADVFRLNVGGDVQTFFPLGNDTNRTDSELSLQYVGVRDVSATLGVAEVVDGNALRLTGENKTLYGLLSRLNEEKEELGEGEPSPILADLELFTLDGRSHEISAYAEVDGVGTVTLTTNIGDDLLGRSVGFAVAKRLPEGVAITWGEDAQSFSMSYLAPPTDEETGDLLSIDLFYVAGAQSDPTQLDANFIKVYVQPPAPTIAIEPTTALALLETNGNFLVSESTSKSVDAKTEVAVPLVISNKASLGSNGFLRIEADYGDWSDKQWLLGTGEQTNAYSPVAVASDLYEGGYAAVWTIKQVDVLANDLSTLRLSIPDDWSGQLSGFKVSATAVYGAEENTTYVSLTEGATNFQVEVLPVADGVDVAENFNLGNAVSQSQEMALEEDVAATFLSNAQGALQTEILKLKLFDPGSEGLAIRLTLAESAAGEAEIAHFVDSGLAPSDGFIYAFTDRELLLYATAEVAADSDTRSGAIHKVIADALVLQQIKGVSNFSGDVTMHLEVGTFEGSALRASEAGSLVSWMAAGDPLSLTINPVSDAPSAPTVALTSNPSMTWGARDAVTDGLFFQIPVYFNVSGQDPSETLELVVDWRSVLEVGGQIAGGSQVGDDYVITATSVGTVFSGEFQVSVPDTVTKPLSLSFFARSTDSLGEVTALSEASGEVSLVIPFEEPPRAPVVNLLATGINAQFNEDARISLDEWVNIRADTDAGRSAETLSVSVNLGSNELGLRLYLTDASAPEDRTKYVEIASNQTVYASDLLVEGEVQWGRLVLLPSKNAVGTVPAISVTVTDTSDSGYTAQTLVTGSLSLVPVVDGVGENMGAFTAAMSRGIEETLGELVLLKDADGSQGLLGGVILEDPKESYSVRLGFNAAEGLTLSSADAVIVVGDQKIIAFKSYEDGGIYFSLPKAVMESGTPILLQTNTANFGAVTSGFVEVTSVDGVHVIQDFGTFAVTMITDPLAPQLAASDVVVDERVAELDTGFANTSGFSFPVDVPISASRTAYEKIGLRISADDEDVSGGYFLVADTNGTYVPRIDTVDGEWLIYNGLDSQLDLSTLRFVAPTNFYGDVVFSVTPFAATADKEQASDTPVSVSVQITASAEQLTQASLAPTPLKMTEVDANLALDGADWAHLKLLDFIDHTKLSEVISANGAASQEILFFDLILPDGLFLYLSAPGESATLVQPISSSSVDGSTTYRVADSLTVAGSSVNFNNLYVGSQSYESSAGEIAVKVSTLEPLSGDELLNFTTSLPYEVAPVANGVPTLMLLKKAGQVNESSTTSKNGFQLSSVINPARDESYDSSEDLSIFIASDGRLNLTLYEMTAGANAVELTTLQTVDGEQGWLVDVDQLPDLYIRGKDYFSSGSAQTINFRLVSQESDDVTLVPDLSDPVSFSLTVKPVADGIVANSMVVATQGSTQEFTPSLRPVDYTLDLAAVVTTRAVAADASETLFYKIELPKSELTLVRLDGSAGLPSAYVSGSTITYEVPATDLALFGVRGMLYRSSDDEGSAFDIGVAAFTKEADGLASGVTAFETFTLTVDAQAGSVFHSVPSATAGSDNGAGVAFAVRAYTLDPSESLSASLEFSSPDDGRALADGDLTFLIGSEPIVSGLGGFVVVFDSAAKTTTLQVDSSALAGLKDLRVSSANDFRSDGQLNVQTRFTVVDGDAATLDTLVSSRLGIYKPVPEVAFEFSDAAVKGSGFAVVDFSLARPDLLPSGIELKDVTVLLSNVHENAYFVVRDNEGNPLPVGASFSEIPGLWVVSGADLFQEGIWSDDKKLTLEVVGLDVTQTADADDKMSATAVVVDALGGTSATQANVSAVHSIDLSLADPLIFSWDGADIVSSIPTNSISLDFDNDGVDEFARYWLPTQESSNVNYSFLVRGSVAEGAAIEMSDLYQTFDELIVDLGLVDPSAIVGEQWGRTKLWSDLDADGFVDADELQGMPVDFELTLPAEQVVQYAGAGFQIFYEADASYVSEAITASGKIFGVGIPYTEPRLPGPVISDGAFAVAPVVTVAFVSQTSSPSEPSAVPEDAAGGPAFIVGLSDSLPAQGTVGGTHLIALQISIKDATGLPIQNSWMLSLGARQERKNGDGSTDEFWLLSESSIENPVRIVGLPEHFAGTVDVQAMAYVTATSAQGVPVSTQSEPYLATLTIDGVADRPLLVPEANDVTWDLVEGGDLYFTSDGTFGESSVLSAFSADQAEDLSIQFTLSGADVEGMTVSGATELSAGVYEVGATDLADVKLALAGNQKTDFSVEFVAVSKQSGTLSQSADSLTFGASVQPDADNLLAETTTFSLSAANVDEGGDPIKVSFSALPVDASEAFVHQVLVGSLVGGEATDSILGLSGYYELSASDLSEVYWSGVLDVSQSEFESGRWMLFERQGLADQAGVYASNADLYLEAFYDGSLIVAQSAYTRELQNGDTSDAISNVSTLTVAPLVDIDQTQIYFADVEGNPLDTIALTEGDALGKTLRLYARSSDTDEELILPSLEKFTLPEGLSATFLAEGDGYNTYRIVAAEGLDVSADGTLALSAEVGIEDSSVSAVVDRALNIELLKVATPPSFTEGPGLVFSVLDGQKNETYGDKSSAKGVYFSLPVIDAESRSDDTLTYLLEGIPKWMTLANPVGSRVASTQDTYSLQFEEGDLADLRWRFDRGFVAAESDEHASATLSWLAVHTEPTNFKSATSDPVEITIKRAPYPSVPVVFGPRAIAGTEGEALSLNGFDVKLGRFEELLTLDEKNDSVTVMLSVQGRTLTKTSKEGEAYELSVGALSPDGSSAAIDIPYAELATASMVMADPDFFGTIDLSLVAQFELGGHRLSSANIFDVEVAIANRPEQPSPTIVDLPESIPENVSSLGVDRRDGIRIKIVGEQENAGDGNTIYSLNYDLGFQQVSGEEVSVQLVLDSRAELWLIDDSDAGGQMLSPMFWDDEAQSKTYDVTNGVWDQGTPLDEYQIFLPARAGAFSGAILARTVDLNTGATSEPAETAFTVSAEVVLHTPELELSGTSLSENSAGATVGYIEISEDYESFFELLSFSPDGMEHAAVTLSLSDDFVAAGGILSLEGSGEDDHPYQLTYEGSGVYKLEWQGAAMGDYIPSAEDSARIGVKAADNFYTSGWVGEANASFEAFDALTTELHITSTTLLDDVFDGELRVGVSPTTSDVLKIAVISAPDTPEFVNSSILQNEKVVNTAITEFIGGNFGSEPIEWMYYFVDPDVFQQVDDYDLQWELGADSFGALSNVASRVLFGVEDRLSGSSSSINLVGSYASGLVGGRESIFEINGSLPRANELIAFKTSSDVLDLNFDLVLADADAGSTTRLKVHIEADDVILPDFDLLFGESVEEAHADAYREALFYGGANDFSSFDVGNDDITQLAPKYVSVVSTFVEQAVDTELEAIMPRLDGKVIEFVPDAEGGVASSNIYGTSGRDFILATGAGGSLLYGGDGQSHDVIVGSEGNDLIILGGGIDYVAGSQVSEFAGDEDIYVVSRLIEYAEMDVFGMTDLLGIYFDSRASDIADEIRAYVTDLAVDKAYVVGVIEDLTLSSIDDGYEAIDQIYFDGFSGDVSTVYQHVLESGEMLLTQIVSNGSEEERYVEAFSILLSVNDSTYEYENAIFFS